MREARLVAALKADIKLPPKDETVKASDIRVDVPSAAPATIDRSKGRDITKTAADGIKELEKTEANAYWGQNAGYAAEKVMMDGGRDEKGNVIQPMSVASLEAIVNGGGRSGAVAASMDEEGGTPSDNAPSIMDKLISDHLKGWKPEGGDPAKWGRKTRPTPQDFLVAAAKERLDKLKEGQTGKPLDAESKEKINAFRKSKGLPPLP